MSKVIITAAVTGSVHTPTMSPYLPIAPDEVVEDAVKAYEAGAAVVHLHMRDPETGEPAPRVDLFLEVATRIKKRCPLVLCPTTGGGQRQTVQERAAQVPVLKPELSSFNMGPTQFPLFVMKRKYNKWKYSWEPEYLEASRDYTFLNTFKTLEELVTIMDENGTRPECEVYEVGMISNVAYLLEQGFLKRPVYIQFILGPSPFGCMAATAENLVFLVETARKTIGDFNWSVAAGGKNQAFMAAVALGMGGNVRVGLEDSLMVRRGELAKSSAEQVSKMVQMADIFGLEVATPDDAREILRLKGSDKVNF
ncbi:3-keto-5-aminohexanoate cleavage protein [Chloroflexota bacterium]